jgi:hypothetical protein
MISGLVLSVLVTVTVLAKEVCPTAILPKASEAVMAIELVGVAVAVGVAVSVAMAVAVAVAVAAAVGVAVAAAVAVREAVAPSTELSFKGEHEPDSKFAPPNTVILFRPIAAKPSMTKGKRSRH